MYDIVTSEISVETEFVGSGKVIAWSVDANQILVNSKPYGLYIFDSVIGMAMNDSPLPLYSVKLSPERNRLVAEYTPPFENTTLGIYDAASLEPIAEIPFDYQAGFTSFA